MKTSSNPTESVGGNHIASKGRVVEVPKKGKIISITNRKETDAYFKDRRVNGN